LQPVVVIKPALETVGLKTKHGITN